MLFKNKKFFCIIISFIFLNKFSNLLLKFFVIHNVSFDNPITLLIFAPLLVSSSIFFIKFIISLSLLKKQNHHLNGF